MKRRVSEMEEEARKLTELHNQVERDSGIGQQGAVNKEETDGRSVYVGNVRYCVHALRKYQFIYRLITGLLQKSYKLISNLVEQSTG